MSTPSLRFKPDADDAMLTPLDASASAPPAGSNPADPAQAAGPVETLPGLDLDTTPRKRRISPNTMLLLGVLAVAGGVLGAMRKVGLGPAATAAATNFDTALVESASKPSRDHRPLLADLNASRTALQVPDSHVRANPFMLAPAPEAGPDLAAAERRAAEALKAEAERMKQAAAQRQKELQTAITNLRLNSVLGGSTPRARINGQLVAAGERVGSFFTLKVIHGRSVELEAEGRLFVLEMEQKAAPAEEQDLDPTRENPAPAQPWAPPTMAPKGGW